MVKVRINPDDCRMEVEGHAGSAEPGRDLVCCAASMLAQALSLYTSARQKRGDMRELTTTVEGGRVRVAAEPEYWAWDEIHGAFEVIQEGFRALAEDYPEYIEMEED